MDLGLLWELGRRGHRSADRRLWLALDSIRVSKELYCAILLRLALNSLGFLVPSVAVPSLDGVGILTRVVLEAWVLFCIIRHVLCEQVGERRVAADLVRAQLRRRHLFRLTGRHLWHVALARSALVGMNKLVILL